MKSSFILSKLLIALLSLTVFAVACTTSTGITDDNEPADGEPGSQETAGETSGESTAQGSTSGQGAAEGVTVRTQRSGDESGETEIVIQLDDATGQSNDTFERETTVAGESLDPSDIDRLLNRLPDLEAQESDEVGFNRPPDTRPRPRPGTTIDQNFPPDNPVSTGEPDSVPLEVLRYQPEGPVDLAPFISVTFNQAMVELGTLDQIEQSDIPVSITPEMPGRWIWLGTRTLRFEYEPGAIDRIPAATNYQVEIPAGTASATGVTLDEAVTFQFSTPTPQVRRVQPMNRPLSTEPLFFIEFDQRVDPEAVIGTIDLLVNSENVPIRLATGDEVNENTEIAALAEAALPDRWLVMRAVSTLPNAAALDLQVGPNIPSAEGAQTSTEVFNYSASTYGPFEVVNGQCGWGNECQPAMPFMFQMSNRIDAESLSADQITVEPAITGMQISAQYDQYVITGLNQGRTDYTVTLSADLMDEFGQRLGEDYTQTFSVGDANPAIFQPGRSLVTLDPIVDDQVLNVNSINFDEFEVTVYEVDPATDWKAFQENQWEISRRERSFEWNLLSDRTVGVSGEANTFVETGIDLSDEFSQSQHLVVIVGPKDFNDQDDWQRRPFAVWVQRTKIGVDAVSDNAKAIAWVTDLTDGSPISGASVAILGGPSETTNSDGIAEVPLIKRGRTMIATAGEDQALIGDFWSESWSRQDALRWYVLDDRGLYKPGETARLKGWVRRSDVDVPSNLDLPDGGTVAWTATDAFGNEIANGTSELSPQGGFDLEIELPADITLGFGGVQFQTDAFSDVDNNSNWHQLNVQEFRRPDFEVTATLSDDGPQLASTPFQIDAEADYFAGGALAGSPLEWNVLGSPGSYSPPDWPEYTFGIWVPWWFSHGGFDGFGGANFGSQVNENFSTQTDASGEHGLSVTVSTTGKPRPIALTAAASVTDVTRQSITGSASALVHPAELYVGMKGDRTFVRAGERLDLDVIVVDIDGNIVQDQTVAVESVRLEWQFSSGSWTQVEVPDESCEVQSSADAMVCSFRPSEGGRYQISATVTDDQGRSNLTELTRWVAGGDRPTNRRVSLEELTLIPDSREYQPGDTAEILVQSPFTDAHGLLVVSRGAIDRTETFEFDESGAAIVQVPVTSDDIPGIGLQFEVVGTALRSSNGEVDPSLPARPAFASGQLALEVPADERRLTIDVTPRDSKLTPGAETQVDVQITGPDGGPVPNAEMVVVVVDEAVLSLTGYQIQDPLSAFYQNTGGLGQVFRGRASLLLASTADGAETNLDSTEESDVALAQGGGAAFGADEDAMSDDAAFDSPAAPSALNRSAAPAPIAEGAKVGADQPAIELRSNFDALAVFQPEVTTDADGKATIDVPLPDNLTRYRVMVVATADADNAGTGDSNITARLPITVRPTPPRFTNFGDQFEFPVLVQNATDDDLDVDVALRSTNLNVDGRAGTTVRVPANDRVEVRFEVSANEAGIARYQVAANAGDFADAAEGELPVYTPATSEAFATYGVVEQGSIAQPFTEPQDVFPQFGGLEITTSSTAVAALTDAMIYLNEYRYDSSDAFASRIIAIVSLDDILASFNAEQLPSADELRSVMNSDIDRLSSMQNADGGFPYWRRGRESIPYNTVQVTHALVLADQAGYAVDEQVLSNAKFALANIEDFYPSWYSERTRVSISAYALHVRNLAGDRDTPKASSLYQRAGDDIELDVAAWLWPVLADTEFDQDIDRLFNNRVTETPNAATFATRYGEDDWVLLHSDRRTDAIVLEAFVTQRPNSDLVLKALNGLLEARDQTGRWGNVQENSFVLLAGAAYFEQFEDADPDFIARAWLGDTYAVEHDYRDQRTTDRNLTVVPMAELVGAGDSDLVVARDGDVGRLYYRLGLRYAPTDFNLEPRDQGFVVQRSYESIDDDSDVVRNDDGTWTIKAGARVRVRLDMVADSRRTHVALVDPIPAGFEIVNPALATSEPIPQEDPSDSASSRYWWYRWFDHQNARDDRAEAFATWMRAGSYEYTYVARATTPGTFVTPPARAEQMYEPEVFGRSSSTTVQVVDS